MTQITTMVCSLTQNHILESKVRWVLGSITMNKVSGGDGIPVELFQILKDDAVKVLHSICQQIWKTHQWPQEWKRSVFILLLFLSCITCIGQILFLVSRFISYIGFLATSLCILQQLFQRSQCAFLTYQRQFRVYNIVQLCIQCISVQFSTLFQDYSLIYPLFHVIIIYVA